MEKHIFIKPTPKVDEKKTSGGGSEAKPHFTDDEFIKDLKDIRSNSVFKIGNKNNIIFIVELADNKALYDISKILKYFNGELIYFISEYQFLMKCEESSIQELEETISQKKLNLNYKKWIKTIKAMSLDEKLSKNLIGMRSDSFAKTQKLKILGVLMPKFNELEYQYLIGDLKANFVHEDIHEHEYFDDSLLTFTAYLNLSRIEEMALKPYIYRISEAPRLNKKQLQFFK